jgi:Zn-dependent protease
MLQGSWALGRVAGIDIRAHYSWGLAFAVVAWSTAHDWFPISAPGFDSVTYWLIGASAALLLFGSVLAHELSHSLVAHARGLHVHGITLFVFGGFSRIESAQAPVDDFLISIVGPLASFGLAGVFWLIGFGIAQRLAGQTFVGLTVEEFVVEHALRGGRVELVVLEAGRLAGIVTVADARPVPRSSGQQRRRWPGS